MSRIWVTLGLSAGLAASGVSLAGPASHDAAEDRFAERAPVYEVSLMTVETAQVALVCTQNAPDMACTAIEAAMAEATGQAPLRGLDAASDTTLIVTLEMTRVSDQGLEARLTWYRGTETPEAGPLVGLTVADTTINDLSYTQLAKALLNSTNLPY